MLVKSAEIFDDNPQNVSKADLRKFNKAEASVNKTLEQLGAIVKIDSEKDLAEAMMILSSAKTVETLIENKRKELVKPWNIEVKRINDYARALTEKIPAAIRRAKDVVIAYNQKLQEEAKKMQVSKRVAQLCALDFQRNENTDEFQNQDIVVERYAIENFDDANWQIKINQVLASLKDRSARLIDQKKEQLNNASFFGEDENTEAIKSEIEELKTAPVISAPAYSEFTASKVKGIIKTWTFEINDESLIPREYLMINESKIRQAIRDGARSIAGVNIFQKDGLAIR